MGGWSDHDPYVTRPGMALQADEEKMMETLGIWHHKKSIQKPSEWDWRFWLLEWRLNIWMIKNSLENTPVPVFALFVKNGKIPSQIGSFLLKFRGINWFKKSWKPPPANLGNVKANSSCFFMGQKILLREMFFLPSLEMNIPGNSAGDLFGMVKWPFQRLSDLQPGDIKRSRLESPGCESFIKAPASYRRCEI